MATGRGPPLNAIELALFIILFLALGWIPILGPFIAGYLVGMHLETRRKSLVTGFISSSVSAVILAWIFYVVGSEVFVVTEGPLSGIGGAIFTAFFSFGPAVLIAGIVFFALLGAYLGSRVREHLFSKR